MKKKISNILTILITLFVLIIPISVIFICNKILIIIFILISIILLTIMYKINFFTKFNVWWSKNKNIKNILIIYFVTFLIYLIFIILINPNLVQISDFKNALEHSINPTFNGNYYLVFTHWIYYPLIINFLYKIFGFSTYIPYIFNAIILSFVPVLIYLIINAILKNKSMALFGSILFILWPVEILYANIFTPDHISLFLIILSVYLIIKLFNYSNHNYKKIILSIIIGLIIGLLEYFKSFGLVLIIASFIYVLLQFLEKDNYRVLLKKSCYLVLIITFYIFSKGINHLIINNIVGSQTTNSTSYTLLTGIVGEGQYNEDLANYYFSTLESTKYNYKETSSIVNKKIITYLKSNYYLIPRITYNKMASIYSSEILYSSKLSWINSSIETSKLYKYTNSQIFANINQIIYIFIVFGIFLLLIENILILKNSNITFLLLIILGISLMFCLTEVQSRYRYSIEPIMCVCSSIGWYNIKKLRRR